MKNIKKQIACALTAFSLVAITAPVAYADDTKYIKALKKAAKEGYKKSSKKYKLAGGVR